MVLCLSCWSQFLLATVEEGFTGIKSLLKCEFLTCGIAGAQPKSKIPGAVTMHFLQKILTCQAKYVGMHFPRSSWWLFDNEVFTGSFFGVFLLKLSEKWVHLTRSFVRKPLQTPCGNPVRVDADYGTLQIRVKCWWVLCSWGILMWTLLNLFF